MHLFNLGLFEKLYYDEIQLRDRIWQNANTLLTALPLIVGGFVFFATKAKDIQGDVWVIYSYVLLVGYAFTLLYSIFYTFRAITGYDYMYINAPELLHKHVDELQKHYDNDQAKIEKQFKKYTYEQYMTCTSHNSKQNIARQRRVKYATRYLSASLTIAILLIIPYVIAINEDVQKVQIINQPKTSEIKKEGGLDMSKPLPNGNNKPQDPPKGPPPKILTEGTTNAK